MFKQRKVAILAAEKPRIRTLGGEKAPAGMGTPRPGFAKLRVSLERHFSGAKIAQWFGPRTPESRCVFYTENMSSSHRKYVFFTQIICHLHTEKMSTIWRDLSWKREVPGSIPGGYLDENWK